MTPDSPLPRRAYRRLRVPAFYPVPTRTRRDGWAIARQADFLGMLAETGSVIGACEAVGISRHGQCEHWGHPREGRGVGSHPGHRVVAL